MNGKLTDITAFNHIPYRLWRVLFFAISIGGYFFFSKYAATLLCTSLFLIAALMGIRLAHRKEFLGRILRYLDDNDTEEYEPARRIIRRTLFGYKVDKDAVAALADVDNENIQAIRKSMDDFTQVEKSNTFLDLGFLLFFFFV
jgi:hypothetical protein